MRVLVALSLAVCASVSVLAQTPKPKTATLSPECRSILAINNASAIADSELLRVSATLNDCVEKQAVAMTKRQLQSAFKLGMGLTLAMDVLVVEGLAKDKQAADDKFDTLAVAAKQVVQQNDQLVEKYNSLVADYNQLLSSYRQRLQQDLIFYNANAASAPVSRWRSMWNGMAESLIQQGSRPLLTCTSRADGPLAVTITTECR